MFETDQYELLDFGNHRKLERFGTVIVDRPCPVATRDPQGSAWAQASLRFDPTKKAKWHRVASVPSPWCIDFEASRFALEATPTGQVGIFPEQAVNWQFIKNKLARRESAKVLNLFAYTGGSTVAAALAGAEVVHVDAAKSVVTRARRNAELSGLADAPIRWIVEDVVKFVAREVKRGNRYDGIVLDPPSYGHGPKREEWKLTRDLFDLLSNCKQLLTEMPAFFLLSCHTPGFGPPELSAALSTCLFGSCGAGVQTRDLSLTTQDGRRLFAGHAAYWP